MDKVKACCVCLTTDIKLFDICDSGLDYVLYKFSGIQLTGCDVFHHMCVFCSALLLKCAAFRDKCLKIKKTAEFFLNSCDMLANGDLLTIQLTNNLLNPFTVTRNISFIDVVHEAEIKRETTDYENELNLIADFDNDVDVSDDEPLSKIVTDRKLEIKCELFEEIEQQNLTLTRSKRRKRKEKKSGLNGVKIEDVNGDDNFNDVYYSDDEVREVLLTKEQQLEEIEMRKSSKNYLQSLYQCHLCYKGFISEATYEKHVVKHDASSGAFACEICHARFPERRGLNAHVKNSHERNFVCKRCGHISKNRTKAKEHTKWHEGFTYNCELCSASFSKSTTYLSHLRARHSSLHGCGDCPARFYSQAGLTLHRAKAHANRAAEHVCPTCGARFNTELALETHGPDACDASLRACPHCGANFATDELLAEHAQAHARAPRIYSCEHCGRVFSTEQAQRLHLQTVHLGVKRAARGRSSMCEHCGATFNCKAALTAHQRTHTGEKPFHCSECDKRFASAPHLHIHRRIHTGERPFKCSSCPKAFRHKAALNRHTRVHTGAKPYACGTCDKRFSQSNSAKSHVALVHHNPPKKRKHVQ